MRLGGPRGGWVDTHTQQPKNVEIREKHRIRPGPKHANTSGIVRLNLDGCGPRGPGAPAPDAGSSPLVGGFGLYCLVPGLMTRLQATKSLRWPVSCSFSLCPVPTVPSARPVSRVRRWPCPIWHPQSSRRLAPPNVPIQYAPIRGMQNVPFRHSRT